MMFFDNLTNAASYQWNFGDGAVSTGNPASHIFNTDGTYNVTVVLNGDVSHPVTTTVTIRKNPAFAFSHLLAGSRHWHARIHTYMTIPDSIYAVADTTFAIHFIDDSTLAVDDTISPNKFYLRNVFSSSDTMITYTGGYNSGGRAREQNEVLWYFPAKDSVSILHFYYYLQQDFLYSSY